MGKKLMTDAILAYAVEFFSETSIWAILFVVLLLAVGEYALCRYLINREREKRDQDLIRLEREHRYELEENGQRVLSSVSQRLLTPITLIISPLQQMASEPLNDDVRVRIQMVLRNAQILLHQVNMLPSGMKSDVMGMIVPPLDTVMTTVSAPPAEKSVPPAEGKEEMNSASMTDVDEQARGIDDNNVAVVAANINNENHEEKPADQRFTMLMVDDSPDMCRFVHDYFRGEYHVLTASNGEHAVKVLEEHDDIDLVVSDVTMPKMNGLELCKQIKTDLRWSHIPVILLTGRRGEQLEVEGLRLGADDYITKPFNVEMLRLRVKKFIEKRESRQREFRENLEVVAKDITITSVDEQFIQRAMKICQDHISDTEFSVEALGHELSLSRTYLYKKLINITGKGPAEFIRTIRMKRGKQYLEQGSMPISDISASLGYSSPKRFTENFKAEYGMSPTEYMRRFREERNEKIEI